MFHMPETRDVRTKLVCAARRACDAFHSRSLLDVEHIFCTTPVPAVEEHGLPGMYSFIGQRFTGVDKVKLYFELASREMPVEEVQLPPVEASAGVDSDPVAEIPRSLSDRWLVDVEEKAVVVVGAVTFTSPDRQRLWTGKVSFHLRFIEQQRREVEESEWRVEQMEIWNVATACAIYSLSDIIAWQPEITDGISPDSLSRHNTPRHSTDQPMATSYAGPVSDDDLDIDLGGP